MKKQEEGLEERQRAKRHVNKGRRRQRENTRGERAEEEIYSENVRLFAMKTKSQVTLALSFVSTSDTTTTTTTTTRQTQKNLAHR